MKKVIGIGNALTDILVLLKDDSMLKELNLPKGSMQLIEEEKLKEIIKKLGNEPSQTVSGGSAANTIHGLSALKVPTSFIGKIGFDSVGEAYELEMRQAGIKTLLTHGSAASGTALAFVSPNSERTFASYLGAAIELTAQDISAEDLRGYDVMHIEGYLLQNYDLIEHCLKTAKAEGLKTSLDLASYNVVELNLPFLKKIIGQYIDIVFANEEEARAYTGKEEAEALAVLAEQTEIAIVKWGSKGSLIRQGEECYHIRAQECQPIDTTGAGDLYAAGFLYGWSVGASLEQAGTIGTMLAAEVIQVHGAKIPEERWKQIMEKLPPMK